MNILDSYTYYQVQQHARRKYNHFIGSSRNSTYYSDSVTSKYGIANSNTLYEYETETSFATATQWRSTMVGDSLLTVWWDSAIPAILHFRRLDDIEYLVTPTLGTYWTWMLEVPDSVDVTKTILDRFFLIGTSATSAILVYYANAGAVAGPTYSVGYAVGINPSGATGTAQRLMSFTEDSQWITTQVATPISVCEISTDRVGIAHNTYDYFAVLTSGTYYQEVSLSGTSLGMGSPTLISNDVASPVTNDFKYSNHSSMAVINDNNDVLLSTFADNYILADGTVITGLPIGTRSAICRCGIGIAVLYENATDTFLTYGTISGTAYTEIDYMTITTESNKHPIELYSDFMGQLIVVVWRDIELCDFHVVGNFGFEGRQLATYTLRRSLSSDMSSPITVYQGSNLSTLDTVPGYGTYYYQTEEEISTQGQPDKTSDLELAYGSGAVNYGRYHLVQDGANIRNIHHDNNEFKDRQIIYGETPEKWADVTETVEIQPLRHSLPLMYPRGDLIAGFTAWYGVYGASSGAIGTYDYSVPGTEEIHENLHPYTPPLYANKGYKYALTDVADPDDPPADDQYFTTNTTRSVFALITGTYGVLVNGSQAWAISQLTGHPPRHALRELLAGTTGIGATRLCRQAVSSGSLVCVVSNNTSHEDWKMHDLTVTQTTVTAGNTVDIPFASYYTFNNAAMWPISGGCGIIVPTDEYSGGWQYRILKYLAGSGFVSNVKMENSEYIDTENYVGTTIGTLYDVFAISDTEFIVLYSDSPIGGDDNLMVRKGNFSGMIAGVEVRIADWNISGKEEWTGLGVFSDGSIVVIWENLITGFETFSFIESL